MPNIRFVSLNILQAYGRNATDANKSTDQLSAEKAAFAQIVQIRSPNTNVKLSSSHDGLCPQS